jgi:amidohydrolase
MIDDGLIDRFGIDEVYGMHNAPGVPVGMIATRPGPLQASADEFEIVVTGLGGHAAEPHKAIDTTLVAAQIVVTLHSIVSRNVDPLNSVVLTVGTFQTDSNASNIIPETARMRGTVRCLNPEDREKMEARVRRVVEDTASAFGATAELHWDTATPSPSTTRTPPAGPWRPRAPWPMASWTTPPTPSCRPRISPTC